MVLWKEKKIFGHQCLREQQREVRMLFSRMVGSLDQESDLNEKQKFTCANIEKLLLYHATRFICILASVN